MIYRFKYEKREEVKYIGHLDCMRTFTRCIKRTNLPVKFSEGFNPRVQLSFALPLGVGVTSSCEYFDLELASEIDEKEAVKELNKTLPEGFRIITVQKVEKSKSLMSLVKEAMYDITIENDSVEEFKNRVEELLKQDTIIVEKETKNRKIEELDIKEMIIDYNVEEISYNFIRISIHSTAGSEKNFNPNLIIEAIKKYIPDVEISYFDVHRKELILK